MSQSFAQSFAFYLKSPSTYIHVERLIFLYILFNQTGKLETPRQRQDWVTWVDNPPPLHTHPQVTETLLFEGAFEGWGGITPCEKDEGPTCGVFPELGCMCVQWAIDIGF